MSKLRIIDLTRYIFHAPRVRTCMLTTHCTSASAVCRMCILLDRHKDELNLLYYWWIKFNYGISSKSFDMNCSPDHHTNLCAHCVQFLEYISGIAIKLLTDCWWQHIPDTWEVLNNLQREVSKFVTPIMILRKWLFTHRYMHRAVLITEAPLPLSTVWALPTAIVMSHKDPTTTASSYVVSIRNRHSRWQALAMVLKFQILTLVSVT